MNPAGIICGVATAFLLCGGGAADDTDATAFEQMLANFDGTHPGHANDPHVKVEFHLYTRSSVNVSVQIIFNDTSSLANSNFNPEIKTIILIHGYLNTMNIEGMQDIKNAALKACSFNVIVIDYSKHTFGSYIHAVKNARQVGYHIGKFILFLKEKAGLDVNKVHIIGFSLGAHVAGYAGKYVKIYLFVVGRITGLDPALPLFNGSDDNRLAKTDAAYVDIIHTCTGLLGFTFPIGHADFYPTYGVCVQPGCFRLDFVLCSHGIGNFFFAASFNCNYLFETKKCEGLSKNIPSNCEGEGPPMGYPAGLGENKKMSGVFLLTTNSKPPYPKTITTEKCSYCGY